MKWGWMVALALAASGCSFRDALTDYCEETGSCACTDGECCALYDNRCAGIGCCGDLVCSPGGFCLRPNEPKLSANAPEIGFFDMPAADPGTSSMVTPLVITNTGTGPTTQLKVDYSGSPRIEADTSDCLGRVLDVNQSCTINLVAKPVGYEEYQSTLYVSELGQSIRVQIRATGGARVAVLYTPGMPWGSVQSTPEGILCPATCDAYFPVGTHVTLSPMTFWGQHVQITPKSSGPVCSQTGCEIVATARFEVNATFLSNVLLVVRGGGEVALSGTGANGQPFSSLWQGVAGGSRTFSVAHQGPLTLTPKTGTFLQWGGACAGQGETCTTEIPTGRQTYLEVEFQ